MLKSALSIAFNPYAPLITKAEPSTPTNVFPFSSPCLFPHYFAARRKGDGCPGPRNLPPFAGETNVRPFVHLSVCGIEDDVRVFFHSFTLSRGGKEGGLTNPVLSRWDSAGHATEFRGLGRGKGTVARGEIAVREGRRGGEGTGPYLQNGDDDIMDHRRRRWAASFYPILSIGEKEWLKVSISIQGQSSRSKTANPSFRLIHSG